MNSLDSGEAERQHPQQGLSSVSNAIDLLKAFSADDPELGISELSKRLGPAKREVDPKNWTTR